MKNSFLKSFFNPKESLSKNNFNIHSVDLDDSYDSSNEHENFSSSSSNFNSRIDNEFKRKLQNMPSKELNKPLINIKSPNISKTTNLSKFNISSINSPSPSNVRLGKNVGTPSMNNFNFFNKCKESKISPINVTREKSQMNSPMNNKSININSSMNIKAIPNMNSPINFNRNNMKSNKFDSNYFLTSDKDDNLSISNENINVMDESIEDDNESKYFNFENNSESKTILDYDKKLPYNINSVSISNKEEIKNRKDIFDIPIEHSSENCKDEVDNTKLKALHLKLQSESNKIFKWKENTEKEIIDKNKKLEEYEKIIESLRNSNLDLQMRQENISLNYQDEIETRSDVIKKIDNSRQLCHAIKNKIENLEIIYQQNNTDKENISCNQEKIRFVISYFFENVKRIMNIQQKLKNHLVLRKTEIENLKVKNQEIFNEKNSMLEDNNIRISKLENNLKCEKESFTDISQKYQEIVECNECLKSEIDQERILSKNLATETSDLSLKLKKFQIQLNESQEVKDSLENKIKDSLIEVTKLCEEISNLKIKLSEDAIASQIKINELNECIKENENQIESYKESLNKKIEESDENKNVMNRQIEELYSKLSLKDESIDNLTTNILDREQEISQLNSKISNIDFELRSKEEQYDILKINYDKILEEIDVIKSSNKDLREELTFKNSQLKDISDQLEKSNESYSKMENEFSTMKSDLLNSLEATSKLEDNRNLLYIELKTTKDKINDLNKTNLNLQETLNSLQENNTDILSAKENMISKYLSELNELKNYYNSTSSSIEKYEAEVAEKEDIIKILQNKCQKYDIDFQKKRDEIRNISENINEKSNQIQLVNSQLKILEDSCKEFEKKINEKNSRISTLESFIDELSCDKQNILKSREDLRKELMHTLEQCKNENEVNEKKRIKEIENLKKSLDMLNNENQTSSKKIKSKLQETLLDLVDKNTQINTLQSNINSLTDHKKFCDEEIIKLKQLVEDLNIKLNNYEKCTKELEAQKANLENKVSQDVTVIDDLLKNSEIKDNEISKLKAMEFEYYELKNCFPPCTQVPDYIMLSGATTPKAQNVSTKLNSKNNKTPQKTPRGILRQPGSAIKKRKVFFEEMKLADNANLSDRDSNSGEFEVNLENTNKTKKSSKTDILDVTITPKRQNLSAKLALTDSRVNGRLSNIRKTPSKAPIKLIKDDKNKENWFDSENFFGIGLEA